MAYRRLRGVDQMYLALESRTTPMHFGAVAILEGRALLGPDGRLRLDEIRRDLAERVRGIPELRRIVRHPGPLAGPPLWIDDPAFRIERHVGVVDVPAGADEDALLRSIERLMVPCLDRSRPLWRLWFIAGLSDDRVALLFVAHHALTDGLGAMRLARSLLDRPLVDGGVELAGPSAALATESPPCWWDLVRDNADSLAANAASLARPATWHAVVAVARSFRAGMSATRHEPPSSLNTPVGSARRLAVLRLDQRAVRAVARAQGGGANDVVLDLVAGALRSLLAARDEPIDRLAPRAGIAVALLPTARDGDNGNHFGGYVVPLPIRESDPLRRLRIVTAAWAEAKRTQGVSQVTGVRVWTARFGPTRALMARQRFINVMETYLPGPPHETRLLGARVLDLIPLQPLGRNVGLTFLASSYAGRMTITVRADADGFPDLDVVMAAMDQDWRTLAETMLVEASPPSTTEESSSSTRPVPRSSSSPMLTSFRA